MTPNSKNRPSEGGFYINEDKLNENFYFIWAAGNPDYSFSYAD